MNKEILKLNEEPIKNIDWHLSKEGQISNTIIRKIKYIDPLLNSLKDILRIIEPQHISYNIIQYTNKRNNTQLPKQTRIFYNNRMLKIFNSALLTLSNMTIEDEKYLNISKEELIKMILNKRFELGIDTFKNELLKKYTV